jgi:hypothetical protein
MGALRIVPKESIITMDDVDNYLCRNISDELTWQEQRDAQFNSLLNLVYLLERQYVPAINKERILLLSLLKIYYTKIMELCHKDTRLVIYQSKLSDGI